LIGELFFFLNFGARRGQQARHWKVGSMASSPSMNPMYGQTLGLFLTSMTVGFGPSIIPPMMHGMVSVCPSLLPENKPLGD
jgi:hypothetical protein